MYIYYELVYQKQFVSSVAIIIYCASRRELKEEKTIFQIIVTIRKAALINYSLSNS